MKAVILAGGFGTRLNEETALRPKPLVEIGQAPIIWHIMKIYSTYGVNEFVICLGYKGHMIKDFFLSYLHHRSDLSLDFKQNSVKVRHSDVEPWTVHLVDTGLDTLTGGRLMKVRNYVKDEPFHMTYGDGVADIDIQKLEAFHDSHSGLVTMTAVHPPPRFGNVRIGRDQKIHSFIEKNAGDAGVVNGGFFVIDPKALDYIPNEGTMWEREPLSSLAVAGELYAYKHEGFWSPMDTIRDKENLEKIWSTGQAPWRIWDSTAKKAKKAG